MKGGTGEGPGKSLPETKKQDAISSVEAIASRLEAIAPELSNVAEASDPKETRRERAAELVSELNLLSMKSTKKIGRFFQRDTTMVHLHFGPRACAWHGAACEVHPDHRVGTVQRVDQTRPSWPAGLADLNFCAVCLVH